MALPQEIQFRTNRDGSMETLSFGGRTIPLRHDRYRGMKLWLQMMGEPRELPLTPVGVNSFSAHDMKQDYRLSYQEVENALAVTVEVFNRDDVSFCPRSLVMTTGIDCYMEKYPQWNDQLFPTLLRCEKTHFWGYCMSPQGTVLTMSSPDPVSSWNMEYSLLEGSHPECYYLNGGHRIYTFTLHLLNAAKQPDRHPQMEKIEPQSSRRWTFYFSLAASPEKVQEQTAYWTGAPMLTLDRYTVDPSDPVTGRVIGGTGSVKLTLTEPDGQSRPVAIRGGRFSLEAPDAVGLYTLRVSSRGKVSEGSFYVKRRNAWYLKKGRDAILENPPLHTHHLESFLSLHTILLARMFLPDEEKDGICEEYFKDIVSKLYDPVTKRVRECPSRIQDSASLSLLMAERYTVTRDPEDLRIAGNLADFLMECQGEDGAYYSMPSPDMKIPEEGIHYTAVAYIAKYVLDVSHIEKDAAIDYPEFAEPAARHRESAHRAMAELERSRDNIETEGQMTFEDGMISCSLLQIAARALEMVESPEKDRYRRTACEMAKMHRCLTQQIIPDCRQNGATLRFWEAQYNIHLFHNAMNTPCGWTCWKLYGDYYLYLLTADPKYLREAMNGLGACLQLVDGKTGHLRWAFVSDPYIESLRYVQKAPGLQEGRLIMDTVGEEYLEMVSPWHRKEAFPRKKWAIDNLVHEVFKCLCEISLTNAFVYYDNGNYVAYNCRVTRKKDQSLIITPREELVRQVHCNFPEPVNIEVRFAGRTLYDRRRFGWIRRFNPTAEE